MVDEDPEVTSVLRKASLPGWVEIARMLRRRLPLDVAYVQSISLDGLREGDLLVPVDLTSRCPSVLILVD